MAYNADSDSKCGRNYHYDLLCHPVASGNCTHSRRTASIYRVAQNKWATTNFSKNSIKYCQRD